MIPSTLPSLPGYAIGDVIKKSDLDLIEQREKLAERMSSLDSELKKADDLVDQSEANTLIWNMIELKREIKKLTEEIKVLSREASSRIISSYQLDYAKKRLKVKPSDKYSSSNHPFEKTITICGKNILQEMRSIISPLMKGQDSHFLSIAVDDLAQRVFEIVGDSECEMQILGDALTFSRVKKLGRPVIRQDSYVSPELIKNSEKYCIIAEAALGAVFFGVSVSAKVSQEQPDKGNKGALSNVFYFQNGADGAITSRKEGCIDLKATFDNWSRLIHENKNSGYPIRYQVRPLNDVFNEPANSWVLK